MDIDLNGENKFSSIFIKTFGYPPVFQPLPWDSYTRETDGIHVVRKYLEITVFKNLPLVHSEKRVKLSVYEYLNPKKFDDFFTTDTGTNNFEFDAETLTLTITNSSAPLSSFSITKNTTITDTNNPLIKFFNNIPDEWFTETFSH